MGMRMEEQKKQRGHMKTYEKRTKQMLSQRPKKFLATGQANTKMYEIHRCQGRTDICSSVS